MGLAHIEREDQVAKAQPTARFQDCAQASDKRDRLETFDLDTALAEAEARPITQAGDLWLLGDRLLCGDSTNADDMAWLMDGRARSSSPLNAPYGSATQWNRSRGTATSHEPGRKLLWPESSEGLTRWAFPPIFR